MIRTRSYPIFFLGQVQYSGAAFDTSSCAIVPYRSIDSV
jgi:hypothetical protein